MSSKKYVYRPRFHLICICCHSKSEHKFLMLQDYFFKLKIIYKIIWKHYIEHVRVKMPLWKDNNGHDVLRRKAILERFLLKRSLKHNFDKAALKRGVWKNKSQKDNTSWKHVIFLSETKSNTYFLQALGGRGSRVVWEGRCPNSRGAWAMFEVIAVISCQWHVRPLK